MGHDGQSEPASDPLIDVQRACTYIIHAAQGQLLRELLQVENIPVFRHPPWIPKSFSRFLARSHQSIRIPSIQGILRCLLIPWIRIANHGSKVDTLIPWTGSTPAWHWVRQKTHVVGRLSIEPANIRRATQQGGRALWPTKCTVPEGSIHLPHVYVRIHISSEFSGFRKYVKTRKNGTCICLKVTECAKKLEMARLVLAHKELKSGWSTPTKLARTSHGSAAHRPSQASLGACSAHKYFSSCSGVCGRCQ